MTLDKGVPFAYYDIFSIGSRVEEILGGGFMKEEVFIFSYLSCLLAIYDKKPISDWEYGFVTTGNYLPYSREMEYAFSNMFSRGHLQIDSLKQGALKDGAIGSEFYSLSDRGKRFYQKLRAISSNASREQYHEAACASLNALPIGAIRDAFKQEPQLMASARLESRRELLTGGAVEALYEQFAAVNEALGFTPHDLMIPSITWLSALATLENEKVENNDQH